MKQISLTLPENLLEASKDHSKEVGYRNIQEFILDLIRKKVILGNIGRYKRTEKRMKEGVRVKKLSQKEAEKYLKRF